LFGSYANGKPTQKSDIDLLIDFNDPTITLFELFRIKRAFEKTLGTKVDLVETPLPQKTFITIDKVVPLLWIRNDIPDLKTKIEKLLGRA